ncbi:MAG: hypothetical protein ACREKL_01220, partial [Chthoniobacterales bacterium]
MFNVRDRFRLLLAGDAVAQREWLGAAGWSWAAVCCAAITLGGGVYGATLGLWRDALQGVFTSIKFPLLVFLTCGANAALNGCIGQLLGSGLGFRQTTLAILMAFTVTAIVLAACAPLMLFLLWNTPPLANGRSIGGHSITLLAHVTVIALAGVAGLRRLYRLIVLTSGCPATARKIFVGWLAGNLLLGAQLAWVLRP